MFESLIGNYYLIHNQELPKAAARGSHPVAWATRQITANLGDLSWTSPILESVSIRMEASWNQLGIQQYETCLFRWSAATTLYILKGWFSRNAFRHCSSRQVAQLNLSKLWANTAISQPREMCSGTSQEQQGMIRGHHVDDLHQRPMLVVLGVVIEEKTNINRIHWMHGLPSQTWSPDLGWTQFSITLF